MCVFTEWHHKFYVTKSKFYGKSFQNMNDYILYKSPKTRVLDFFFIWFLMKGQWTYLSTKCISDKLLLDHVQQTYNIKEGRFFSLMLNFPALEKKFVSRKGFCCCLSCSYSMRLVHLKSAETIWTYVESGFVKLWSIFNLRLVREMSERLRWSLNVRYLHIVKKSDIAKTKSRWTSVSSVTNTKWLFGVSSCTWVIRMQCICLLKSF